MKMTPFNTWDCNYMKSILIPLMHINELLIKKYVILFCDLLNMEKQLFLMCLFLCLSLISLGRYYQNMFSKVRVQKKDKKGKWPYREVVCKRGEAQNFCTLCFLVESTKIGNKIFPFTTTLWKAMLRQIEWAVQNGLITKNVVLPVTTSFFWKFYSSLRVSYIELI